MESQVRYTTTADGASIAFTTIGSGPVVIMTSYGYTFPGSLRILPWFQALVQAIGLRFTFVLYDGRGMGLSSREHRDHTLQAQLADLDAVIRAVDVGTFSLYGWAMGGPAAMAYAARHPDRVASLIVADSFPSGERFFHETQRGRLLAALGPFTADQWHAVTDMTGVQVVPDDAEAGAAREVGALFRETWEPEGLVAHRQATREIDVSRDLAKIAVPTLVVAGGAHRSEFESSRELASAIPQARLLRVETRWTAWAARDYAAVTAFLAEHMEADAGGNHDVTFAADRAGLTAREVEVFRLIVAGKTGREIAAELVLSPRTVERHIANIYRKTDTHGRAQLAGFALRRKPS